MSRKTLSPHALFIVALASVFNAACSPQTNTVDGSVADLSAIFRDLSSACGNVPNNLLQNFGFESGSGSANNNGSPVSTIASWDGCCSQMATPNTDWSVSQSFPHCGMASLFVKSTSATSNVLSQTFTRPGDFGHQFTVTGNIYVTRADATTQISIDLYDITADKKVASSSVLTSVSNDWVARSFTGQIPTGGHYQVRINSSGTLEAYVDDLSLILQ